MFIHGGFEPEFPNKPLDSLISFDLNKIATIYPKLSKAFGKEIPNILGESFNNNKNTQNP